MTLYNTSKGGRKLKKLLLVFLVVVMLFTIAPVAFATTPIISTTVDKTDIEIGDIVTVTVKSSAKSELVALTYELNYDSSEFKVVSEVTHDIFEMEKANISAEGKVRYIGASLEAISETSETFLTIHLEALKPSGTISAVVKEAYVKNGVSDETNVTSDVAPASDKTITFKPDTNFITLRTPSKTSIRYKDGLVLYADLIRNLPSDSRLVWTADNDNFIIEPSGDGTNCTIVSDSKGKTQITVTLYDSNSSVIETETIEITSKAGFLYRLGGFFRDLFGLTKIHDK